MKQAPPQSICLKDYRPPDYLVPRIELDFAIHPDLTRVRSVLAVTANYPESERARPLELDGEGLRKLTADIEIQLDRQSHRDQESLARNIKIRLRGLDLVQRA